MLVSENRVLFRVLCVTRLQKEAKHGTQGASLEVDQLTVNIEYLYCKKWVIVLEGERAKLEGSWTMLFFLMGVMRARSDWSNASLHSAQ